MGTDNAIRFMTVQVKKHGAVDVIRAFDEAGNERMVPLHGAATLEEWRADKSRLAPWLLSSDLEEGQSWAGIMEELEAMGREKTQ